MPSELAASQAPSRLRLGRYETFFRIASGGMAEVHAARMIGEAGFQKVVAIKRMLPTLAQSERFVEMFLDEARIAAAIESPHVVQTLDLGKAEDGSLYIVMELVVGASVGKLLAEAARAQEPWDPRVAMGIVAQAARGLHDAHEATTPLGDRLDLVHRDVSPQNILVRRSGRVQITDFGVAKAMHRATHTRTGETKGKLSYFAPEQARAGAVDRRTDIFALGIVAWELLAGRRLFRSDNPLDTLRRVTEEPIPRPTALRLDLPAELDAIVMRCLERDPAARFQTARELAEAIEGATPAPASREEVAELVERLVGDSLDALRDRLRSSLRSEGAPPGGDVVEEEATVISDSGWSALSLREATDTGVRAVGEADAARATVSTPAPVPPVPASPAAAPSTPAPTLPSEPAREERGGGRRLAIAAILALAVLGGAGAALWSADAGDDPAAPAASPATEAVSPENAAAPPPVEASEGAVDPAGEATEEAEAAEPSPGDQAPRPRATRRAEARSSDRAEREARAPAPSDEAAAASPDALAGGVERGAEAAPAARSPRRPAPSAPSSSPRATSMGTTSMSAPSSSAPSSSAPSTRAPSPEPPPAEAAPAPTMRGPLNSLDAFDRSVE
ncbi:MAG TPA: serine/threonine-protein kinase [Polyangiaceae bacterium LLY-WYZ-15_(1-7)]|nr:serine/threonine-protein kinase [Polyangiaceae bacterium LLY-WYZ-15_(1-7)]HJL13636.1 serine/threonine-protein kinase [Polyangiaceae bacterium LLY-WYZ-15_(1-7)]